MSEANRYGTHRVRAGLIYFLSGKAFSAVAGILTLIFIVRDLSLEAFAIYSVLIGFVEIITAISGVGLPHILARYLPELFSQHKDAETFYLLCLGIILRTLVLVTLLFAAYCAAPLLAGFFQMTDWIWVMELFLLLIFFRVTGLLLFQVLESLLHQKHAQNGILANVILKFFIILLFHHYLELNLANLLWIEIGCEIVGIVVFIVGIGNIYRSARVKLELGQSWIKENLARILRFGLTSYGQHLAILFYGGAPNRLLAGKLFSLQDTATFGFAQSLFDMFRRYLPAQLLQGLIRPLVIARFSKTGDFSAVTSLADSVLKLNLILIGALIYALLGVGADAISIVTEGKHGDSAATLLCLLMMVLAFESVRLMQDFMIGAVEKYEILLLSNIILSASILLAIPLLPYLGMLAIPSANIIGLLIGNLVINNLLAKQGYRYAIPWLLFIKVAVGVTAGFYVVELLAYLDVAWYLAFAAGGLCYALILIPLKIVSAEDWDMILRVRGG